MIVLIILGVFVLCGALAYGVQRFAAQKEAPNLSSGYVEQDLRGGMSPSVMGALVGVLPFLVFVVVLVVMAMDAHRERLAREAAAAAERGDSAAASE
jgi:hypothetical protein